MRVTLYGTRGSVPVSGKHVAKYGGNTTCLHIESSALPHNHWLAIDAGTGILPFGAKAMVSDVEAVAVLFTHYHHDHTQGFMLCPLTFNREISVHCYGPAEDGKDPTKMLEDMMAPPYFPLTFPEVSSHISGDGILSPSDMAIVIHPERGFRLTEIDDLEHFDLRDCLVIRMQRTNHPQKTISYRFEEKSTGKTMVFLTDHENTDGTPQYLRRHLADTDLLIMDSQYGRNMYDRKSAGFGHATPDYCVRVAHDVGARRIGLTHHDPFSSDETVDYILQTAHKTAAEVGFSGEVFACADYLSVTV